MSLSKDGKRVAFLGNDGERQVIGLDDGVIASYTDRLPSFPLALSGDGRVVAYRLLEGKKNRCRVVVDGREGPDFETTGTPVLSHDGRVVAYWIQRDDLQLVRIGNREEPAFEEVTDPAISSDGSTVAYGFLRDQKWFLKMNAEERPLPAKPHLIFLSGDGRHVGWIEFLHRESGGSKLRVVAGGVTGESFGIVGIPSFSPDGSRVTYAAEEGGLKMVVIGTRRFDTPDRVDDPAFSPDGRTVGYGALVGRDLCWKVIKD